MDLNSVSITGNLTRDVELRHTEAGTAVTTVRVAVSGRRKDASGEWVDAPSFLNVVLWGRQAEVAHEYCQKGSKVAVSGRIQSRTWEAEGQTRYETELVSERFVLLGGRDRPQEGGNEQGAESSEDIPF